MSDAARRMDRIYRHQRHIYDATRKFYLLGRDGLITNLDPPRDARILEVGCGTGRNLIRIAHTFPRALCYGIDISQAMLETAQRAVARAGLAERITLMQADATTFDPQALFAVDGFERIVISYALSMIPPWRDALAQAARALAPGGSLHLIDFGDQARLPKTFKRLLGLWLARFHVTPRETLPQEAASLAASRGLDCRPRVLFRGYAFTAELAAVSPSSR